MLGGGDLSTLLPGLPAGHEYHFVEIEQVATSLAATRWP